MNGDQATEAFRRALNILFVANPRGTSLGVLLGVALDGAIVLLKPWLKTFELLSFSSIKIWHLMSLGVLAMNIRPYLQRDEVDPRIVNAIAHIDSEKAKGHITDLQARKLFADLQHQILKKVIIESSARDESRASEGDAESSVNKSK
ncbi:MULTISPECIES: hypothetical protein [unclassified Pseudomonas]|jgi:hypothetical protein|uniref:hypothetical protein n=1 Tax=unclassified Pseudomonas TaxID=196821 RepID=UPI001F57A27D|nr:MULTISPECIES: hypothetical protein [unclassified Pseudomonas]